MVLAVSPAKSIDFEPEEPTAGTGAPEREGGAVNADPASSPNVQSNRTVQY